MGCGSSKSAAVVADSRPENPPDREETQARNKQQQNASEETLPHRTTEQENNLRNLPDSTVSLDNRDHDDYGNSRDRSVKSADQISIAGSQDSGIETSNERPTKGSHSELPDLDVLRTVPKAVAFDVPLANTSDGSIIRRHPPRRLQKLESVPRLTPAMLEEKLKSAEERKEMELQKKTKSAARTSRRHRQIREAMEFEKSLKEEEIDRTLSSAERKRRQKQEEIVAKQRLREERAKRAREKAQRMSSMEDVDLTYEMENDENFNADDEDSWGDPVVPELLQPPPTGTTTRTSGSAVSSESERIYDGRSSPVKRVHPRPGAALRRGSSGTGSIALGLDAPFSGRVTSARTQHQLDELFERKNVPAADHDEEITVEDEADDHDFFS
ncbi:Hypp2555 [Branchiostoma lanceolatum]|uniref:Hypp2555 protein n=1 Tax=Branchiostoma lanceolatum TaxID=7740 RepID=A0A8K0ET47_BRALA|nr:Hypp2555 [Branchiostoma lanceolatum]